MNYICNIHLSTEQFGKTRYQLLCLSDAMAVGYHCLSQNYLCLFNIEMMMFFDDQFFYDLWKSTCNTITLYRQTHCFFKTVHWNLHLVSCSSEGLDVVLIFINLVMIWHRIYIILFSMFLPCFLPIKLQKYLYFKPLSSGEVSL